MIARPAHELITEMEAQREQALSRPLPYTWTLGNPFGDQLSCPMCSKSFASEGGRQIHITRKHPEYHRPGGARRAHRRELEYQRRDRLAALSERMKVMVAEAREREAS